MSPMVEGFILYLLELGFLLIVITVISISVIVVVNLFDWIGDKINELMEGKNNG